MSVRGFVLAREQRLHTGQANDHVRVSGTGSTVWYSDLPPPLVSPADDGIISPVRVPAAAPVDLLPIEALSPAIRRIWQARHKPSPVKRKPQPAPAPAPVKPKHRSPVTRTPLADKSNHEWSASPSLSPVPVAKKHPSPARVKKLSPVYKKAILRTYKSRGATSKRTIARPASSSSESEDEGDAGPSSRARTVKTRPSVDESDSDITPPARSTKNAAPRSTTASHAPAPPPPPSPSVISISSDSEDDDYQPSPMPSRRRATVVKQPAPTRKRPGSPAPARRDAKGKARAPAPQAQEETVKFFDSDSDDVPVAASSNTAARARTVRARAVIDHSDSDSPPLSQTAKTLGRRATTSKPTASIPPPLPASSGAESRGSSRKDSEGDLTVVAPRHRPAAPKAAQTNRVASLRTATQARRTSSISTKAAARPAAGQVIGLSDSDSDDVSLVAALKTPVKAPARFKPKTGLVPVVMLTPLRRPTLGGHGARASPARVSFVARTATPVRAVAPSLRRKGTPLRAGVQSRAPSPLSSPSSTSLDSLVPPAPEIERGAIPEHLLPLLHECGQDAPYAFDSFLEVFRFDALHAHAGLAYRKLGEASFSEVYAIGDVVLKIVPLRDEGRRADGEDEGEEWNVPDESDVQDVLREICITREMGALCPGFVQLLKVYVVRGTYPKHLLKLWDEYNDARKSESLRPDGFPASQAYGVLVLPNLGTDLETFTFKPSNGWSQASAIFWQVARALRTAEQEAQFEHRDLHWGQVLVRRDGAAGVRATIIDLGLSRMQLGAGNAALWAPIDEEVFEGKGDYQFDVYRMMRAHSGGEWAAFRPLTNVMWMHYLAVKLTQGKRLRAPASAAERRCAEGLFEAEQALASSIAAATGRRKAARKTFPVFGCVADVVGWAEERGWM